MPRPTVPFARGLAVALLAGVAAAQRPTLPEARADFETSLVRRDRQDTPLAAPPAGVFSLVEYDAPSGPTSAYLTRLDDVDEPRAAILWLQGGFPTSRGGPSVWSVGPPGNEQSASAYREAGVVMMFPTVRGTGTNPGSQELMMGEVDDVIAAGRHLAGLAQVDPERVYLGGHSTGATLALLVAESTDLFAAVFAFGPASDFDDYGGVEESWPFDTSDPREFELRSPRPFLDGITSPTYVVEGRWGRHGDVSQLDEATDNPRVRFLVVDRFDHFEPLAPCNALLAARVASDAPFAVTVDELAEACAAARDAALAARDDGLLADLRERGASFDRPQRLRVRFGGTDRTRLGNAIAELLGLGFGDSALQAFGDDDAPYLLISMSRTATFAPDDLRASSREVAEILDGEGLDDEGWDLLDP